VIITTGRIRRTLVNKIYLLVYSPRSIEASRLALVKAESIFLRHASGCFGTSRGSSRRSSSTTPPRAGSSSTTPPHADSLSSTPPRAGSLSTTSPLSRVWVPWHVVRLVTRLVTRLVVPLVIDYSASRRLVVDYFDSASRLGVLACRAARRAARRRLLRLAQARRRLLRLRHASWCLGTSCGSSPRSSSTSPPRADSSSTTSPRAGSSLTTPPHAGSSSTTSPPPRVWVPQHIAWLITRLVASLVVDYSASRRLIVDYFASAARPGASAR
jgi:hypothetical protein